MPISTPLPRPRPRPAAAPRVERGKRVAAREPTLASAEHLGAYGPLIDAIRDELEHFVASHVRLHLAIAERDRFLLTAVGIGCEASDEARRLLQQFVREFKPEQVKRYLAREVIGGLPNAAAIDLSQFAGLFDADAARVADEEAEGGEYRELLEALRTKPIAGGAARLSRERARPLGRARPGFAHDRAVVGANLRRRARRLALGTALRVRRRGRQRPAPGRAARRDAGTALCRRQRRGRRHPGRGHLRQPSPCRGLAGERRLVGGRRRLDQRRAHRAGGAAAARRLGAGDGGRDAGAAAERDAHRPFGTRRGSGERVPLAGAAAAARQRLDGHADRHRERHAAHAAHRDPGGAGRARPGDADDPDPAGGGRRERVPPHPLACRRRAHPAADAGSCCR